MSAFTAVYEPGYPEPDYSIPRAITSNKDCVLSQKHSDALDVLDSVMKNRFSCRFFLPDPVDKAIIESIIDAARHAPSGNNMQPWEKVYCISGHIMKTISEEMVKAHKETPQAYQAEYHYYPAGPIPALYAKRRFEFGKYFYAPLHVDHSDLAARARVSTRNYEFFDAPLALIFTTNRGLTQGSWMDLGMFIQNITLAARTRGLETITQEAPAKYQLILRNHLPISDAEIVACAMTLGYPDAEKIAQFSAKQPKREVADIISFFGM